MVSTRTQTRAATLLVLAGVAVLAAWGRALYPLWSRTGPAPGAGAQYVFILIPSVVVAAVLLATGTLWLARVRARDPAHRSAARLAVLALGIVATGVALYWVGRMVPAIIALAT